MNVEPNPMPRRILIMGTPVAPGNRGVMALGASLVHLCGDARPDASIAFLQVHRPADDVVVRTPGGDRRVEVVTCRMSPRAPVCDQLPWILALSIVYRVVPSVRLRSFIRRSVPWIDAVAGADVVGDVRGGDSFSDIYGCKRFILASLAVWSVILLKGTIIHFPQTYGPFRTRTARWIARELLRRSSAVIARDPESRKLAQSLVGDARQVGLSPDVAFALHPYRHDSIEVDPPLNGPLPENMIGLNVNGLMLHGGYSGGNMFGLKLDYRKFLILLVTRLLEVQSADLLLVPHTFAVAGDPESDNDACRQIRDSLPTEMRGRIRIVTGDYDAHELKGIIGRCDFFIGSRMHSCIAALSQGVPCVGVAYSMKFAGVFASVGMGDWVIDGRDTNGDQAVTEILERFASRDAARAGLADASERCRRDLSETFSRIVSTKRGADPVNVDMACRSSSVELENEVI